MKPTASQITCERGLGPMLDSRCAARWREANGKVPGTTNKRLLELQSSKCAGCPYGKPRAEAGLHLAGDPNPVPRASGQVLPLAEVRARLLQRAKPVEPRPEVPPMLERRLSAPEPKPEPERSSAAGQVDELRDSLIDRPEQPKEETMDRANLTCAECGAKFAAKATGKPAIVCSVECRKARAAEKAKQRKAPTQRSSSPPRKPARERPAPPLERAARTPAADEPASVQPWAYSLRVQGMAVRCRTLQDLVAVVQQFGGGNG